MLATAQRSASCHTPLTGMQVLERCKLLQGVSQTSFRVQIFLLITSVLGLNFTFLTRDSSNDVCASMFVMTLFVKIQIENSLNIQQQEGASLNYDASSEETFGDSLGKVPLGCPGLPHESSFLWEGEHVKQAVDLVCVS